jgi:hypothetical protein
VEILDLPYCLGENDKKKSVYVSLNIFHLVLVDYPDTKPPNTEAEFIFLLFFRILDNLKIVSSP